MVATSCSDNRNMEKMIPSNATGVICIKVPNFIKKAKLDKGGDCVLPDQLKSVIDKQIVISKSANGSTLRLMA